ncbi:BglG family transcription antiterminator [Listeria kieliensis]
MIQFDIRKIKLLHYLLENRGYIAPQKLQEVLGISKRTLQYEIEKTNFELEQVGFSGIQMVRRQGYYVPEDEKNEILRLIENYDTNNVDFTMAERKVRILLFLLATDARVVEETLSKANGVSRNTTLQDLKQIKAELSEAGLKLLYSRKNGNEIVGDEAQIRQFFLRHCLNSPAFESETELKNLLRAKAPRYDTDFLQLENEAIRALVTLEKLFGMRYTDEVVARLSLIVSFFSFRMQQGHTLEGKLVGQTKWAQEIYRRMPRLVAWNEAELAFLERLLLGANRLSGESEVARHLKVAVKKMIAEFERLACVNFEDHERLKRDLLLHLEPAYYRVLFGIEWINPLRSDIKSQYAEVYEITRKVMVPFGEMLAKPIPEDEVAYVAILFGGFLSRKKSVLVERKKLLIICSKGVGTSRMIERQLKQLFTDRQIEILEPISLREFEKKAYQPDFIVATLPVLTDIPSFIVSPILTEPQKEQLLKEIMPHVAQRDSDARMLASVLDVIDQYAKVENREALAQNLKTILFQNALDDVSEVSPGLSDLLPAKRIQFKESAPSWQEAIRLAAKPLLEEGYISQSYENAMITGIETLGPYVVISPGVALPHAAPADGAFRVGMSLLLLDEPVAFSKKPKDQVKLLIVLSSIDSYTHINALSELTELIMQHDFLTFMEQHTSAEQVAQFIREKTS